MREAIRLSFSKMRADCGGPFGAVIVHEKKIIASGWNQVTSQNDPTAHAEILAIRAACRKFKSFRLDECELYSSCEPCPMCLAAIYWARLRKIYYGNTRRDAARINFDDELISRELAKPRSRRKIPMKQVLRKEAIQVFDAWGMKGDKVIY
ncbi:MAG TPA: nucleoside deaminase [Candidatus Angelobacter sp.]|jgi:guanine deaminase|nr:nucleoside deaminase [Candidatus Angelobacter sp.]